jgi:hypothetical protein
MNCANCGKQLPPRINKQKRYCNRRCSYQAANKFRRQTRHLGANNQNRKAVKVIDDLCAAPYFISMNEYILYKEAYQNTPGIHIEIFV